jgi:hypothetical protein
MSEDGKLESQKIGKRESPKDQPVYCAFIYRQVFQTIGLLSFPTFILLVPAG